MLDCLVIKDHIPREGRADDREFDHRSTYVGELDRVIPWMQGVYRPAINIGTDGVASRFLTLHQRVVAGLAHCLDIAEVEEQRLVALVRSLVVGHRCAGMMPVAFYDDAAAALAGVEVAEKCLLANAVRAAPARVGVELAILVGFR